MNSYLLSFFIASVTCLIIFTLELWKAKTAERKHHPPRFVEYATTLETLKEANRIIDASINAKQ